MLNEVTQKLDSIFSQTTVPSCEALTVLLQKGIKLLTSENPHIRKPKFCAKFGGLLSFSDNLPTVIVPDLHARWFFIKHILDYSFHGKTCLELLCENKLRIICVGDILHSESRGKERWLSALNEYNNNNIVNDYILEEMTEGLKTVQLLITLKEFFPDNFHILKGNHENIKNVNGHGNYSFYKYAYEGTLVYEFMFLNYGEALINLFEKFEKKLPLIAVDNRFVVSHSEPARAYTQKELIACSSEVIAGLTWTKNGDAHPFAVLKMLEKLTKNPNSTYFAGHRPVTEKYKGFYGNKFIQIHNPIAENIVYISPDRPFNLETDIVTVYEEIQNEDGTST